MDMLELSALNTYRSVRSFYSTIYMYLQVISTVGRDPQYRRNIVAEAPPLITAPVIVRDSS